MWYNCCPTIWCMLNPLWGNYTWKMNVFLLTISSTIVNKSQVTIVHLVKCAWSYKKRFWCVWLFSAHTKKLTNCKGWNSHGIWSVKMYSPIPQPAWKATWKGAFSDGGVGTTLSKHMLQFCITQKRKPLLFRQKNPDSTKLLCERSPFCDYNQFQ